MEDAETLIALHETAVTDPEWEVRTAACEAIGRVGGEDSGLALAGAMADPRAEVRAAACDAATRLAAAEVAPLARRLLFDDEPWWRAPPAAPRPCWSWMRPTREYLAEGRAETRVGLVVSSAVHTYNAFVLVYFAGMNLMYLVLLYQASRAMLDRVRRSRMETTVDLMRSPLAPGVTVIVPAYNEQECIVESVRSLLALRYPRFQIVVVNDGSSDETVKRLHEAFALEAFPRVYVPTIPTAAVRRILRSREEPRLIVADKRNGGKADALNAGINLADDPLICAIDADAMLEEDALLRRCRPFLEQPDEVVATGGIVRIANGCRIEHGQVAEVGCRARGWPRSRWSSTCAPSSPAAPAGAASTRC